MYDEDSYKAYWRIMNKMLELFPKEDNSKNNYLNQIKFETLIQNNAEFDY